MDENDFRSPGQRVMDRVKSNFDSFILYVDDEEMARKYFVHSFGKDYPIIAASGADHAMDILRERNVGILVTDYRMPGKDGGELLRQAAMEFPLVVRILVTAYADRSVLLDTVNSGEIFRILEKPLDSGEVRMALHLATELSRERNVRQQRLMAIDETLAFLAHELNTPLAAIVNYAKGIERRISSQEQPEIGKALGAIDGNARYCLSLLSSFVESVHGAGSEYSRHAGTTAQKLIDALLDAYPLSHVQRAAIRVDVREDFRIPALPDCVMLVLSSILGNALRAVKDIPSPTIGFAVRVEGNPQIRIVDNGPGIRPEVLDHLLQDPITTHAEEGGKGWGMIFCNRIMQSFGGSILIHSAPGEHTAVTLNFPSIKRSNQ